MTFYFPPRQMRIDAAAYYCGLSESAFHDRVRTGRYPPGAMDGGARVWLRDDLDEAINRRFGVGTAGGPANDGAEADPFAARLRA